MSDANLTPDDERAVAQLYADGVRSEKLGVSNEVARAIARRHGVPLRRRGRALAMVTAEIRAGVERGESNGMIADRLGVSKRTVQRARREAGVLTVRTLPSVRSARFDARCLMLAAAGWRPTQIARKLGASVPTVSRALRGWG